MSDHDYYQHHRTPGDWRETDRKLKRRNPEAFAEFQALREELELERREERSIETLREKAGRILAKCGGCAVGAPEPEPEEAQS